MKLQHFFNSIILLIDILNENEAVRERIAACSMDWTAV